MSSERAGKVTSPAVGPSGALESLGLGQDATSAFRSALAARAGLILVAGPRSSGKTTTLRALARRLVSPARSVLSIETQVGEAIDGAVQIACKPEIGMRAATILRNASWPRIDAIVIDDLADDETIGLAVRAAARGSLVLTGLLARDAADAAGTMLANGVEPFLLGSVLRLIHSQRLLRRTCEGCKHPVRDASAGGVGLASERHDGLRSFLSDAATQGVVLLEGAGCEACGGTGYRGFAAVSESLVASPRVASALLEEEASGAVFQAARAEGMRTLGEEARRKMMQGVTTIEEGVRHSLFTSEAGGRLEPAGTGADEESKHGPIQEDIEAAEREAAMALAAQLGLPFLDLGDYLIEGAQAALVPADMAWRYRIIPVSQFGNKMTVATVEPLGADRLAEIAELTGFQIRPVVVTGSAMDKALRGVLGDPPDRSVAGDREGAEAAGQEEFTEHDESVIRLCNLILSQAIANGSDEILIEPAGRELRVRYREGLVLHDAMQVPAAMRTVILRRLKVMGSLDLNEQRFPQCGRMRLRVNGQAVDLSIRTLPLFYGEQLALAVHRKIDRPPFTLETLGLHAEARFALEAAMQPRSGLILVAGPTFSGKTVTLYCALQTIDPSSCSVVTAEDPVQLSLPGVAQTPCNPRLGLTFASAMRTFVRQRADVILLQELRDIETAELAFQAAQRGSLVLSMVHANNSIEALVRLGDMGIGPGALESTLRLVQAQRLVRRLCDGCKSPWTPDARQSGSAGFTALGSSRRDLVSPPWKPSRAVGCEKCNETGYSGHELLAESWTVDASLIAATRDPEVTGLDLRRRARAAGLLTLREAGLLKVLAGVTTLEEVLLNTPRDE